MTQIIGALFTTAIPLGGSHRLMLFFPLCLSIAIVYKTLRTESIREIPISSLILWGTIILGMYVVGVGLWALFSIMA